jgi:hypothetical protein
MTTAPTVGTPSAWRAVAVFIDQLVVDPDQNLRAVAEVAAHDAVTGHHIVVGVIRCDDDEANTATSATRWNLKDASPEAVMGVWADAKEIAQTLNRSLGQVVS